jgi:hypothetical protein
MSTNTITVQGREIPFEHRVLDIHQLRYYPDNPRINYIISTHAADGPVSQETIEQSLLLLETTKDLVRDIEENGGLLEEILVIGNEVVEGNTRLAVYRRLARKFPNDPTWRHIPAKVLSADIQPTELFFILGTFHIKGKNQWSAYEKAAYIHRMVRKLDFSAAEVAHLVGHHAGTVEAMLKAYESMRDIYLPAATREADELETQEALRRYSYFEAFYRTKDLAQRAGQSPQFVHDFSDWVLRDVFPKAEVVRSELPKILGNKRALQVFTDMVDSEPEDAFEEAQNVLYETKPEKVDPFYKAVNEFRSLLRATSPEHIKSEIADGRPGSKPRRTELLRCFRDLKGFCRAVGLDDC